MSERVSLPDGGWLAHRVDGVADPTGERTILLCRPLIGSMDLWGRFLDLLAERTRVICFDHRGSGRSGPARLPTTTRGMARDALALLDHLDVPAAHVFGLSLGGMVATWLAIDAPHRVRHLALASTPARGTRAALSSLRGLGGARRAVRAAGCLARGGRVAGACLAGTVLSTEFRADHPDQAATILDAIAAEPFSRRGVLALLLASAAHDARSRLAEIQAPTLVMYGDRDPLITPASEQEIVQAIPGAELAVIAGAGHALTLEQPEAAAAVVARFIGSQTRR